jgi:hypothetical protein
MLPLVLGQSAAYAVLFVPTLKTALPDVLIAGTFAVS